MRTEPKVRICKLAGCANIVPWCADGPRKYCSERCSAVAHKRQRQRARRKPSDRKHFLNHDDTIDTLIELLVQ
jgi:hypothetical protein